MSLPGSLPRQALLPDVETRGTDGSHFLKWCWGNLTLPKLRGTCHRQQRRIGLLYTGALPQRLCTWQKSSTKSWRPEGMNKLHVKMSPRVDQSFTHTRGNASLEQSSPCCPPQDASLHMRAEGILVEWGGGKRIVVLVNGQKDAHVVNAPLGPLCPLRAHMPP